MTEESHVAVAAAVVAEGAVAWRGFGNLWRVWDLVSEGLL